MNINIISYIASLCLFFFVYNPMHGQNSKSSISGNIVNSESKQSIPFATILLLNWEDEGLIKSESSGNTGEFIFENLKKGSYKIRIISDEHTTFITGMIIIKDENQQEILSKIELVKVEKNRSLNEVTVTFKKKKKFIESKIDRTVLNVDALESNSGITALELLNKAPGISVSNEGVVSLRGKSGATIFIDDRPTYLSGAQLESYLNGLSSDIIDKIEIMTNPPAKYEAAGNAGVINIKLKKNKQDGENGNLVVGLRQHKFTEYNTTFNFNQKKTNYNMFINASFAYKKRFQDLFINRNYLKTGGYSRQESNNVDDGVLTNLKVGADYNLSKNTIIGIVTDGLIWNGHDMNDSRNFLYNSFQNNDSIIKTKGDSENRFMNTGINFNLNHKFKEKSDISANLDYLMYDTNPFQKYANTVVFPNTNQQYTDMLMGGSDSNIKVFSGKLDYSNQLGKTITLETGLKHSYIKTANESEYVDIVNNISTPNLNQNNKFLYNENISAIYFNSNANYNRLTIQLGLRYENVKIVGEQLGNEIKPRVKNKNSYDNLFPTIYLSYKLDSLSNNTIGINYGKRIDRPFYQDLNPVILQIDKLTFYKGNPDLKPSFTNSVECFYAYKSLLNVNFGYSKIYDQIQETIEIVDNIYYSKPGNVGETQVSNLSISSSFNILKWLVFSSNAQLSYTDIRSEFFGGKLNVNGYNFRIDPILQFKFKKDWNLELFGRYEGKSYVAQFITKPLWFLDVTLSKKISLRSSFKLVFTDVFRTRINSGIINNLVNATADYKTIINSRQIRFSFTYNFGDKISKEQKINSSIDGEKSRIKF